jgi:hypothetical protein
VFSCIFLRGVCQDAGAQIKERQRRGPLCTEVNVADIPAGIQEYVQSLTGTIQMTVTA